MLVAVLPRFSQVNPFASFRRMQKLLLVSILIATIAIPVQMSREKSRAVGVKRTVKWMAGFCVFYLFALMYIYPRIEGY
jgi:hypothetical protein